MYKLSVRAAGLTTIRAHLWLFGRGDSLIVSFVLKGALVCARVSFALFPLLLIHTAAFVPPRQCFPNGSAAYMAHTQATNALDTR